MHPIRILVKLVLFAVLLSCSAAPALARAGGGESFGGSSGGDGWGDGGGGDGLGIILYFILRLVFAQPLIGIPLLAAFIVVAAKVGRSARTGAQYRTITQATQRTAAARQAVIPGIVDSMMTRDPAFDEAGFIRRARQAFGEVQAAWCAQDMSRVRRFISDGVRERFEIQIAMQKAEGFRNQLEGLVISGAGITGATSDAHFDSITVEFSAQARDLDVDLKTGRILRTRTSEPFSELWTFLRRPGASTLARPGLVEGFCPNCGAPLELSDAGKCENCDSVVTSGDYDWVLAEITQGSVWSGGTDPATVPGYREMAAKDPAFNLQHVEDRTSVIFWRYVMGNFEGKADPLRKVSTPSFSAGFEQALKLARDGDWWLFFRDAAVGGVDVQRIVPAGNGEKDRIDVLVRWSARNAQWNPSGQTRSVGDRSIRPTVFVLERGAAVTTQAGTSFLSSHCQGCGAPYEGGESGGCDYCGRPLNDGSQDWVLSSMERFDPSTIRAAAVDAISKASRIPPEVLIASMASAMFADGQVDEREEQLIRSFAAARSVPAGKIDELLSATRAGGATLPPPPGRESASEILGAMARMALADGKLSTEESELLGRFAESAGLARADVSMIVARQRSLLYAEAKAARRG